MSWKRLVLMTLLAGALVALVSCAELRYYSQAALGQARLLVARKPIERLLDEPATPPELRAKLTTVQRVRQMAIDELGLPENGSYTTFVELKPIPPATERRFVTWNVVAAPELSVVPVTWCFPVAGCVSYRGYFKRAAAERFAARLQDEGLDVSVGGVSAYSTLGWFEDPVLSTFLRYPDLDLAGLLIHELAHQVVYVTDDTVFNESFATAVELEGVRRWLEQEGAPTEAMERYLEAQQREEEFTELVLEVRERLDAAYREEASEAEKRAWKAELFAELRDAYADLKASWGGDARYDAWFDRELNNAHLASIGAYRDLVPAFQALLASHGGDLETFYTAVRDLAELEPEARRAELEAQLPTD